MADEFAVGGIFGTVGGFLWLIFAGLYKTPSFEEQFTAVVENPVHIGIPTDIGLFLADLSLALMILGPITWWIVVPIAKWTVTKQRRKTKDNTELE